MFEKLIREAGAEYLGERDGSFGLRFNRTLNEGAVNPNSRMGYVVRAEMKTVAAG